MRLRKAAAIRHGQQLRLRMFAALAPACCWFSTAQAQEADTQLEEIIVTGTLIRGAPPTGANVIGLSQEQVAATGATSTDQMLASIPQIANFFNALPAVPSANQVQVNRPNLRNLPGGNTATGAATLILVDGHRIVSAGVTVFAADADVVPPGVIERVEILTDGGSSLYGADAIGGVINFITRDRFDGLQMNARYGVADNYRTVDANATAGTDWDSGSAYVSYNYADHDAVFGRDRDYFQRIDWSTGVPVGRECNLANVSAGGFPQFGIPGTNYAAPGLIQNTFNACDASDFETLYPTERRNSVFAGLRQDLTDAVRFDLKTFYTERKTFNPGAPLRATVTVTPTNPYYRPLPAPNETAIQNVAFSFAPARGNEKEASTILEEWGVTPTITVDLNDNWQLRGMFNYGRSDTSYIINDPNPTLLAQYAAGTTLASAINPYDIASTVNQQLLADIANYQGAGTGKNAMLNVRAIADGSLFSLPAGDLRVALGAEYLSDDFEQRKGDTVRGAEDTLLFTPYKRHVKSAFAELNVPIFGEGQRFTGMYGLALSLSGRYDEYSDFGDTFNPKFALSYQPVEWLTLRGNWGQSFNAPTPVDQLGSLANTLMVQNFFTVTPPGGAAAPPGSFAIALLGSAEDLQPQEADTYSFGFDIEPAALPGLRASVSYYHIDFRGTLGKAPVFNAQQLYENFASFVTLNPTPEQIAAFGEAAAGTGGAAQVARFLAPGAPFVYQLLDFRTTNLGRTVLSGLDFAFNFRHLTGFGAVDVGLGGNYRLKSETQASAVAPFTDDLESGVSKFPFSTSIGVDIGHFRAQATWNRTDGYRVVRTATLLQDRVDPFDTLNLFFRYDVNGKGLLEGLSFTANVDNVLNEDPPEYRLNGDVGYVNGATLGRLIQFGVNKSF